MMTCRWRKRCKLAGWERVPDKDVGGANNVLEGTGSAMLVAADVFVCAVAVSLIVARRRW
eukprot:m.102136 g.102136  ORF g.102136 m.102136 type:complete len:60 (+) comp15495_c0_seq2:237-416(+)